MKKIILTFISVVSLNLVIHSQVDSLDFKNPLKISYEELSKKDLKKYRKTKDDFSGSIRFEARNTGTSSKFIPYIDLEGDSAQMFLKIRYHGNDWIFLKKITVKVGDYFFPISFSETHRDIIFGDATETVYLLVDKYLLNILEEAINEDLKLTIRFEGDSVSDAVISKYEKRQIKSILDLWRKMKETTK